MAVPYIVSEPNIGQKKNSIKLVKLLIKRISYRTPGPIYCRCADRIKDTILKIINSSNAQWLINNTIYGSYTHIISFFFDDTVSDNEFVHEKPN